MFSSINNPNSAMLKAFGEHPDQLIKGRAAAEGETRDWNGKKYRKQGGKWIEETKDKSTKKEDPTKGKSGGKKEESGSGGKQSGPPSIDSHEVAQMTHLKSIMDSDPDKAYEIYQGLSPEAQAKVPQDVTNKLVANSHAQKDDGVDFDNLGKKDGDKKESKAAGDAKKALGVEPKKKFRYSDDKEGLRESVTRMRKMHDSLKYAIEDGKEALDLLGYSKEEAQEKVDNIVLWMEGAKDQRKRLGEKEDELSEAKKTLGVKNEKSSVESKSTSVPGNKLSEKANNLIADSMKDVQSRVSMRAMMATDNYNFTVQTSQFGNNRLNITDKAGKIVYSGADSKLADKLVESGVPHGGYESKFAEKQVENNVKKQSSDNTVIFSEANKTYQIWKEGNLVNDFATEEKANSEAKRLNGLDEVERVNANQKDFTSNKFSDIDTAKSNLDQAQKELSSIQKEVRSAREAYMKKYPSNTWKSESDQQYKDRLNSPEKNNLDALESKEDKQYKKFKRLQNKHTRLLPTSINKAKDILNLS